MIDTKKELDPISMKVKRKQEMKDLSLQNFLMKRQKVQERI